MTGRKPEGPSDNYPGPGAYNPNDKRPKSPAWSMGRTPRGDFTAGKLGVPGPGAYSPKSGLGNAAPHFGSAKRPPLNDVNDTPGPGAYYAEARVVKDSPSYSMRPRTAKSRQSGGPGPGQYNPSASCTQFKWTMGKEEKGFDLTNKNGASVPGPGLYNTVKGLGGPKWSFGTEQRSHDHKSSNPGPGAYNIFSSISNLPRYAIKTSR